MTINPETYDFIPAEFPVTWSVRLWESGRTLHIPSWRGKEEGREGRKLYWEGLREGKWQGRVAQSVSLSIWHRSDGCKCKLINAEVRFCVRMIFSSLKFSYSNTNSYFSVELDLQISIWRPWFDPPSGVSFIPSSLHCPDGVWLAGLSMCYYGHTDKWYGTINMIKTVGKNLLNNSRDRPAHMYTCTDADATIPFSLVAAQWVRGPVAKPLIGQSACYIICKWFRAGRFALFTSSPWVVSPRVVSPSRWVVSPLKVSRFVLLYIFLNIQM